MSSLDWKSCSKGSSSGASFFNKLFLIRNVWRTHRCTHPYQKRWARWVALQFHRNHQKRQVGQKKICQSLSFQAPLGTWELRNVPVQLTLLCLLSEHRLKLRFSYSYICQLRSCTWQKWWDVPEHMGYRDTHKIMTFTIFYGYEYPGIPYPKTIFSNGLWGKLLTFWTMGCLESMPLPRGIASQSGK